MRRARRHTGSSAQDILRRRGARRGAHVLIAGVLDGGSRTVVAAFPRDGERAGGDTLLEIGSVTKLFTATLLAEMHLRGEVSLSDPISRYLPAHDLPAWRDRAPTLEELATHRSGLGNTPRGLRGRELLGAVGVLPGDPWAGVTDDDYRRMLRSTHPRRAPGSRVRYSSMAYGLLGDALAERTETAYEDLLRLRVLGPLALHDTWVDVPDEARPGLLEGRSRRGAARPPLRDRMPAAGSLRSSADDVLGFLEACLAPRPDEVLGRAITLALQPRAKINKNVSVGLGWLVLRRRRRPAVWWHNGGTWGFRSFVGLVPDERRAVVVLSDTTRMVDRLGFEMLERAG
jgi:CubicO group peptidase (beta-lactamase class C family)